MGALCILCGTSVTEGAHVEARRDVLTPEDRVQNIIRLCPTCHTVFDARYITVHPIHRIFVYSLRPERANLYRRFRYSYPHDGSLDVIRDSAIFANASGEFAFELGENELAIRYPTKPAPQWLLSTHALVKTNPQVFAHGLGH